MKVIMDILFIVDLFGIFAFAVTGVIGGMRKDLDIIGALFCGVAASLGGGLVRDTVLGLPVQSFFNEWYLWTAVIATVLTYFFYKEVWKKYHLFLHADAVGLAVFTIVGATKALDNDLGFLGILFLGAITAVGGGMIRDILIQKMPVVLQKELYVVPSLLGSSLFTLLQNYLSLELSVVVAGLFVFCFRVLALRYSLTLPTKGVQDSLF